MVVLTLVISIAYAAANTVDNKNTNAASTGTHLIYISGPWSDCKHYNHSTGNMVTDSSATPGYGSTLGHCDVWGHGGGQGNGYIVHWINWNCPVSNLNGNITIDYGYSAWATLDCLAGGTTSAKLNITFFIDNSEYDIVLFEEEISINGHVEFAENNFKKSWTKSLTLAQKTYKIGVRASFELSMDMLVGAHSFCSAGIFGNWDSSDILVTVTWPNQAPNKPVITSGEKRGKLGHQYEYTATGTDPDGDRLWYQFVWGDGSSDNLVGPISNGVFKGYHTFLKEGTYSIKIRTEDEFGGVSWSDPYVVTIVKNKAINHPFLLRIFERFSLLQQSLQDLSSTTMISGRLSEFYLR